MGLFGFGKYSQRAVNKAGASLGLHPVTPAQTYGDFAALKSEVDRTVEQGRLAEVAPLFAQAWHSKDRLPSGNRVYNAMLAWVHAAAPEGVNALDAYLTPFATEFARQPTSFTAALYAEALHTAAFVARGTAYAHRTSGAQWGGYQEFTDQATAVLNSVSDVAADDFPWWDARFSLTQSDGSTREERAEIFTRLISLDPGNLGSFGKGMLLALPRWFGTSAEDADRVARWAMEANQEQWGAGGYALAYWELTEVGSLDAADTALDVALAEQGFRDLLQRNPSMMLQNRFAHTMSWAGAETVVKGIFEGGLTSIDAAAWAADSDEEGLDRAARAYLWAKYNG